MSSIFDPFLELIDKLVPFPAPETVVDFVVQTIWLIDVSLIFGITVICFYFTIWIMNNEKVINFVAKYVPIKWQSIFNKLVTYRSKLTNYLRSIMLICLATILLNAHGMCQIMLDLLKVYIENQK